LRHDFRPRTFIIHHQNLFAFLGQRLGHWKVMFHRRPQQIFPSNAVMASGRARGAQLAGANLSRHRQMTYGAIPGNLSDGEESLPSLHLSSYGDRHTPLTNAKILEKFQYLLIIYYFNKL
jgi:hypothetical protein